MTNKYIFHSKISEKKFREIIRYFSLDIEATKIAALTGISRPTINRILKAVRQRIAEFCESESPFESGEVEIDESYFGARRVRGIRGRGARGKHIVFGLIKRAARCTRRLSEIVLPQSFCPSSETKSKKIPSCTRTDLKRMTVWWILAIKSTIESSMETMNLLMVQTISMGLKTSGLSQKPDCPSSVECINPPFICISRNVNLDSIIGTKICISYC